jgi:hypothetical protein
MQLYLKNTERDNPMNQSDGPNKKYKYKNKICKSLYRIY